MTYLKVLTSLLFGYFTCIQSTEFYFKCLKTKIDFTTAQKLCEDGGRKLVTIRNEQEETGLKALVRSEECSVNANWRHAWLNYQAGRWLDGYPLLYNNWKVKIPSTRCAKFSLNGWIIRKCSVEAASVLLCENRDDENAGEYKVLLKSTTIMHTIDAIVGTNGITVTFFVPSSTMVQLEIFDNEITIYLFLREGEPVEIIERKLIATAEDIKLMDVSSGDYTSFTPISIDAKFIISFIAESDCTLYNVNVFETTDTTAEPLISWDNRNWVVDGPFRYSSPHVLNEQIMDNRICKEGTYLDTSSASLQCSDCPAGYYQNLKNATFCKACPPIFTGTETGQTFCTCMTDDCEEDPSDEPIVETSTEKPIATKKHTTKIPTEKLTTKGPTVKQVTTVKQVSTVKQVTTVQPATDAPEPSRTIPIFPGDGSTTMTTVEPKPKCTSEERSDGIYGQFEWSTVEVGKISTSRCFYKTSDDISYAHRRCSSDSIDAYWETPDYTKCATKKDIEIRQMTSTKVTEENAVAFADNLKEMTNSMEEVSSSGVEATVNALKELESHTKPENSQSFVDISSNLLDASDETLNKSKSSLKNLMTKMAKSIAESDTEQKIFTKNVDILTIKFDANKPATVSSIDTNIEIPKSLTSQTNGAYLVVYKTAKLFKAVEKDEKMAVISDLHFSGIKVENSEEIKLEFEEMQKWTVNDSQTIQCVFWNDTFWDDYGCRYDPAVKACFCNHATPFTSILSFKQTDVVEPVNQVVWWIEVICFSASIISCIIFIVIILSIRGLRKLQSFKMHCILAVALLLQYTGYLTLDVVELEGAQCKAIGFLVHWVTLACFLAMFAEALSVYLAIVIVFDTHVSHIVIKVALFCWGTTGTLVGLYAGITEMDHYSCTSNGFLIAPYNSYFLTIPVLCILLLNTVMFGRVVWKMVRKSMTKSEGGSKRAQVLSQLKMIFTLNTMLGAGYLIGLVASFSMAFEIMFVVINGLSGLFLLCLFGIFNPMTKAAIRKSFREIGPSTRSTYAYTLKTSDTRETLE